MIYTRQINNEFIKIKGNQGTRITFIGIQMMRQLLAHRRLPGGNTNFPISLHRAAYDRPSFGIKFENIYDINIIRQT